MMVPAFIMMVPAFMVPDNRVSLMSKIQQSMKEAQANLPYVEDPAVNERSASKRKSLVLCDEASVVFALF